MYLKVRQRIREEDGTIREKWHVFDAIRRISWDWISKEEAREISLGNELYLCSDLSKDVKVARMVFFLSKNPEEMGTSIVSDDDIYLCNDNGQTIERL